MQTFSNATRIAAHVARYVRQPTQETDLAQPLAVLIEAAATVLQNPVLRRMWSTMGFNDREETTEARTQYLNEDSLLAGVLVVDDHGIVREGLIALLDRQGGIRVVGSAATGQEAILTAKRLKPDIIIMDLVLPDMNGIDAMQRILAFLPRTRVIVLSACHTIEHVYRALRAGALGYVVKDALGHELVTAVKAVIDGKQFLSPKVTPPDGDGVQCYAQPKSPLESLSLREREVLNRIVAGSSSATIAQHLSLSRKTVDTYRGRLMVKLGVGNRSALIRFAIENQLTAS
jgi:DNA-binding NarL/FixJ family response regulator